MAKTAWDDIWLAGLGTSLPGRRVTCDEAVAAGWLDEERSRKLGYESLAVDEQTAPPDMAIEAARKALAGAPVDERDVGLVAHASTWFQGLDIWPAASYVANSLGMRSACSFDVQQRCNVGLFALELAAAHLVAAGAGPAALVTTADRFAPPGVDRWNLHDTNLYGDGGTAMVLSRSGGFARLVATATAADNALEQVARGSFPLRSTSNAVDEPVDLRSRAASFRGGNDATQADVRFGRVMVLARKWALEAAGLRPTAIDWVVMPAAGTSDAGQSIHHLLGVRSDQTTWDYARTIGHIGAGDWAASLAHLMATGRAQPGQHVLLFGGGAGFTVTAAVLAITDPLP